MGDDRQIVFIPDCMESIGIFTALAFTKDEYKRYKVWATVVDIGTSEILQKEAGDCLNDTLFVKEMDLLKHDSIEETVKDVLKVEGRIDILIIHGSNLGGIGVFEMGPFQSIYPIFEQNFFGPAKLLQVVVPEMKKKKRGRILVISSAATFLGNPFCEKYTTSMVALESLCETLSRVLSKSNVHLSIVQSAALVSAATEWIIQFTHDLPHLDKTDTHLYDMIIKRFAYLKEHFTGSKNQPITEVVRLLKSIAEEQTPQLRYQTTEDMQNVAARHYVDPSGPKGF